MKTKTLTILIICLATIAFAQDKTPIAEDDYYDAFSLRTDTLRVLINDYAYDEHPFKQFFVMAPQYGHIDWGDSLIYYTPDMYFAGPDMIKYRIIDTENMLFSELATVYLNVENKGMDTLRVNNVNCRINACGLQFWNMEDDFLFEVPANSGLNSLFSQSLWMGGFGQDENLHVAGDRYRQSAVDYFPGPVMDSAVYTADYDINWNRVWMLYQTEIDYHRAHWQDAGYEMIENIFEWPAGPDPELAPFYDFDGNGGYNPENGDFPLIKGDQAVYYILNDDRDVHSQTNGEKLGVEIQAMYYAYHRPADSTLDNTVFASYKIINKSENDYHDYLIGFFNYFELGCFTDNYLGTDTVLNSLYGYNMMPYDCEFQYPNSYGDFPPAMSLTALNFDISSTIAFEGYGAPTNSPQQDYEYYNYLKSVWRDSTHLTVGGQGYGGTESTMFIFPGDPVSGEGWSEVSANNGRSGNSCLMSAGPYNLNAGESIELDFALVFARDYSGGPSAHLNSVSLLKERIAEVQEFYEESLGEEELEFPQKEVEIYPNPFADIITIKTYSNSQNLTYSVFDILGEELVSGTIQNKHQTQINLGKLNSGIYFIHISDGENSVTRKIIKQE